MSTNDGSSDFISEAQGKESTSVSSGEDSKTLFLPIVNYSKPIVYNKTGFMVCNLAITFCSFLVYRVVLLKSFIFSNILASSISEKNNFY